MIPQEARTGFEPVIRVLQTHALPLGYRAIFYCMHWNTKYSRSDPNEIRTRVTAVKGRCLNRLTMGPRSLFVPEAHIHETGKIKTPRVGLEPTTARLTAACSTD